MPEFRQDYLSSSTISIFFLHAVDCVCPVRDRGANSQVYTSHFAYGDELGANICTKIKGQVGLSLSDMNEAFLSKLS